MKWYRFNNNKYLIACILAFNVFTVYGCSESSDYWPDYPGTPGGPGAFIQVDGTQLKDPGGTPYFIQGISFGNYVWDNPSSALGFKHHGPEDYGRVKSMGFNTVRFFINYGLFEDDARPYKYKKGGFDWLNKNIAAAR